MNRSFQHSYRSAFSGLGSGLNPPNGKMNERPDNAIGWVFCLAEISA